jgi:hypothetical protein
VLHASRYDTVLRVTRYVAIRAPGLTILLSLPNYYIMTYCITLGYTTCTDLANDLLHCPDWDPSKLASPHADKVSPPQYLNEAIPFTAAKDIDVVILPDDWGKVDDFIDDGIVVVPDIGDNKTELFRPCS